MILDFTSIHHSMLYDSVSIMLCHTRLYLAYIIFYSFISFYVMFYCILLYLIVFLWMVAYCKIFVGLILCCGVLYCIKLASYYAVVCYVI